MEERVTERVKRATELLKTVRHAAVATVNEDGSPHNSPVFFQYDKELKYLYWSSSPEAQHSQNIARDGRVFVVLYEANEGGGLYIEADNARVLAGKELAEGLKVLNEFRARRGKESLGADYYTGDSPQRLYRANVQKLSVNVSERDEDGNIIRDYREEIEREGLLWQK
jgi:hypothetical protein